MPFGLDADIVDITIADWPIFLPPSFGESILSECTELLSVVNVLETNANHAGSPVPIEWTGAFDPPCHVRVNGTDLLDRVHVQLLGIATRLEWHMARQFGTTAENLDNASLSLLQRVISNRALILEAMSLIGPFTYRDTSRTRTIECYNLPHSMLCHQSVTLVTQRRRGVHF